MPAQRPRAQFEPISPDLDLRNLVESYDHFDFCPRITWSQVQEHGVDSFEKLVVKHVIQGGLPLVVEGLQDVLDPWTFSSKWLKDNVGDKVENARDLNNQDYIPLTIRHYLNSINAVTNQHFRKRDGPSERPPQRIYLKDIDCPEVWQQKLTDIIPQFLYYLNESTGEFGGPGSSVSQTTTVAGGRLGRGIAHAGDLMSSLPTEMRAENLMCYIGHEGTYTPAHREMCASMGHNLMVEASGEVGEDGKPEKPGSSIWFMTEAKDRHSVAEFWLSKLGHDIEVEKHFAQINSWKVAPFKVYIVDQRPGDFVLIPPLAPHQVWNRGTRTMKVAWNRTTVETLEMAFSEALPTARMVCRDEQYKNKAIVYYTLHKYADLLTNVKAQADCLPPEAAHSLLYKGKVRQLQKYFKRLFNLYKDILLTEILPSEFTADKFEYLPFDGNVTCAYCRGNIFNRFLSCQSCKDDLGTDAEEPYDVCMDCYAMGRSCYCTSGQQWVEQFKWKDLSTKYETWRQLLIQLAGGNAQNLPLPIADERKKLVKKTLAEVVRDELRKRPYTDPKKPKKAPEPVTEDVIVDDDGRVKKTVKKHPKAWLKANSICHVCKVRHENWKMVQCTKCDKWWCYGSLFRGHDDMPLSIMENLDWECAHCHEACFAGTCRLDPRQKPIEPKGTLLGHDTKKIADVRSVEALVDFSVSNLNWIREDEAAQETAQMRRAREEGEKAREVVHDDDDDEDHHPQLGHSNTFANRNSASFQQDILDPELRSDMPSAAQIHTLDDNANDSFLGNSSYPDYDIFPHDEADAGPDLNTNAHHDIAMPTESGADMPEFRPFLKEGRQPFKQGKYVGFKRNRNSAGDDLIRMEPSKKQRRVTELGADAITATPKALNEATKQYQVARERSALDQAKRDNRFFIVFGALRGKSKKVVLKIEKAKLSEFITRLKPRHTISVDTLRLNNGQIHANAVGSDCVTPDLLKSDVKLNGTNNDKNKNNNNNKDFPSARTTAKKANKTIKRKRRDSNMSVDEEGSSSKGNGLKESENDPRDEDMEMSMSNEEDANNSQNNPATRTKRGEGRKSAYLEARQSQLPNDDDQSNISRAKKRRSLPAPKSISAITILDEQDDRRASTGRSKGGAARSDGTLAWNAVNDDHPISNNNQNEVEDVSQVELNRRAKMAAFASIADDHVDDLHDDYSDDDDNDNVAVNVPQRTSTSSSRLNPSVDNSASNSVVRKSIFDKIGPGGKGKVKIVSQANANVESTK